MKKNSKTKIDKLARDYAKACSKLPRRPHDQETFIEGGRKGCFTSAGSKPKNYCSVCHADNFCDKIKTIKWRILPSGEIEKR